MRFGKRINPQWLILLLMSLIGLTVYWNALRNPFQYDDGSSIVNNPYIRSLQNLPRFFFDLRFSQLIDDSGSIIHYRPIWSASFAINYAAGGLNPVGYHLVNLAFHVGSAYLLFLILQAILAPAPETSSGQALSLPPQGGGEKWINPPSLEGEGRVGGKGDSFFAHMAAGLIFLVHPFNSEVVNYITARSSVMCAFFYLLAFYFWVRYRRNPPLPPFSKGGDKSPPFLKGDLGGLRVIYYLASLVSFLLAMLTKEIAITLPVILFLYDLYFTITLPLPLKRYIPYLPFIPLMSIPLIMIYFKNIQITAYKKGFIPHLYTELNVITRYLRLYLLPTGLNIDHHVNIYQAFFTPGVFIPAIFLVLYLCIFFFILKFLKREWWWVSFFMLFFLITILPTTIVPLNAPLQENRGYLPFTGIIAAGGILVRNMVYTSFLKVWKRSGLLIAIPLVLLFVVYSAGTINRNKAWQDRYTLWADAVQKSPESPRAHANLAYAYMLRGEDDMAMREYIEALRLEPGNSGLQNDVAIFYYNRGQFKEAESHLKAAIAIRTDYYLAYSNLGLLYERQGRLDDAMQLYQRALLLRPDFTTARERLERVLTKTTPLPHPPPLRGEGRVGGEAGR